MSLTVALAVQRAGGLKGNSKPPGKKLPVAKEVVPLDRFSVAPPPDVAPAPPGSAMAPPAALAPRSLGMPMKGKAAKGAKVGMRK